MSGEFERSDEALKLIRKRMSAEYQNYSTRLRFDELHVLEVRRDVNAMYQRMDSEIISKYKCIAKRVYADTAKELGIPLPGLVEAAFVLAVLRGYDPVTEYVYTREWNRKRDRTVEGIISSTNRNDMRHALKRSLDVTYNQVRQYADDILVEARLQAFEDAGVQRVRWITMADERVCKTCRERDHQVYLLRNVPPRHWHCRCWLEPVI